MRQAFIRGLTEVARRDRRVVLLTGDLGYTVVEPFAQEFPDRFYNMGVAEQNMIGVATGLSASGFIPFAYSIATFASLRGYEFFRNGPVHHRLPVRVIGVGGGFEYGHAGMTHHSLEDIAIMRVQPHLTVLAPADARQAAACLEATWDLPGPIYYRIGKDDKTLVPGLDGRFSLGAIATIGDGRDVLLLAMGAAATPAVGASQNLAGRGIASTVGVVATLAPAPVSELTRLIRQYPLVLTVETHYVTGGLGSLVSEVVAESSITCRVVRCGVRDDLHTVIGTQSYLEREYGISAEQVATTAADVLASGTVG